MEGHDPAKPVTDAQYESVYREPFRAAIVKPVGGRSESLGGRYSHVADHNYLELLSNTNERFTENPTKYSDPSESRFL